MATFLELAQELRQLSGIGGSGPADVVTATGIEARLVNYVKNAWIDIQSHPKDWKWMWKNYDIDLVPPPGVQPLQTVLNTPEYVLVDVQKIWVGTFRTYLTVTGVTDRQRGTYVDYEQYQKRYAIVNEVANRPIHFTRLPTGNLRMYPKPDGVYSIEFEIQKTPQFLVDNGDIPEMPVRYHELIIYEALKRFGKAEDAPEIIKLGEEAAGSDGNEGVPVSGLWRALIWDQELRRTDPKQENEFMVVVPQ